MYLESMHFKLRAVNYIIQRFYLCTLKLLSHLFFTCIHTANAKFLFVSKDVHDNIAFLEAPRLRPIEMKIDVEDWWNNTNRRNPKYYRHFPASVLCCKLQI